MGLSPVDRLLLHPCAAIPLDEVRLRVTKFNPQPAAHGLFTGGMPPLSAPN